MAPTDTQVAVIGGGVVGCAVAHALARHGVDVVMLEAEAELAYGASGANSGILHTGFDSEPGQLETRLILRSRALGAQLHDELGVEVHTCGARLTPRGEEEQAAVASLAANARANGVEARLQRDGALTVPGEAVTNPVAYVYALAGAARASGAEVVLGARVSGLARQPDGVLAIDVSDSELLRARAVVNCAGLFADDVARLAGEACLQVYPRKGEFLVFSPPPSEPLPPILLPVPSALGKGVLVFPTIDGMLIAGPTAREREDKHDWSVEADARELILTRASAMYPPLAHAREIGAYAGLRPAGRNANYVIEPSRTLPGLIHVAAIRSTGLSGALGIGEHVTDMLACRCAIQLGALHESTVGPGATRSPHAPSPRPRFPGGDAPRAAAPWWQRAVQRSAESGR
ncbi:MAG TPA: FAD-dependent oxidoreductase [Solirubrobacteraceae bacterium]|nr:FAD-dependent oxidoreductase [Solirubrobacteraceae bacterium]